MTRVKELKLSWFRGAAELTVYPINGQSVVIYGENGSGKSSFVDGIEVLIQGKCEHLSHEYSGTYQEKGLFNTHRPAGASMSVTLAFTDGSDVTMTMSTPSKPVAVGPAKARVEGWSVARSILRQDQIATFIKATKLDKYSALLPLLGLGHLEVAAENIRQLAKAVADQGRLKEKRGRLDWALHARAKAFENKTDDEINAAVEGIYVRYVNGGETDHAEQRIKASAEIERQQLNLSKEERQYTALKALADFEITTEVADLESASEKLSSLTEALVNERLAVVNAADKFADEVDVEAVDCPTCGTQVRTADLRAHIAAEKERLRDIQDADQSYKLALGKFCDAVLRLKLAWENTELAAWRANPENANLATKADILSEYDISSMRSNCDARRVTEVTELAAAISEAAKAASFEAPASVQALHEHAKILGAANDALGAAVLADEIADLENVVANLDTLEAAIRGEIRSQSASVFEGISKDIQRLWDQFHPDKKIQDVHLHIPFNADKAIDVAVQFHGVEQASPRLTLSEGYRNSLGLSIFLALAMREPSDRPVILDDVVISLDRNHRGMLADILESEFSNRQIVLMTHERDWYIELTHLLQRPRWAFHMLRPWEDPGTGIHFQGHTTSFGMARAHLEARPDSAGNDARKIMDTELPIAAERLKVRLPYRRGVKNDQRTGVEFLSQLISDGSKVFQVQKAGGSEYEKNEAAIELWRQAEKRMIAWGNPASHSFDVRKAEAEKLIVACESAMGALKCDLCNKPVWAADNGGSEVLQCQCGNIRWRYGKA